jgi:cysteine sulfinate desulfinase/cysteine desulfurase-like protein
MGLSKVAKNGLRLSFGFELSESDLELIKQRFHSILKKVK